MKALILTLIIFSFLFSHPGRTDSKGGHNCKQESIDKGLCIGYHYHKNGGDACSSIATVCLANKQSKGYERKNWKHWIDKDGDCQDERNEILIKYSEIPVTFKSSKECKVVTGKWFGIYTGKYYHKASDIDIDHVVPLYEAYISGGSNWSKTQKKDFANDHENLLPVGKSINRSKGSDDPANWLPRNKDYICEYIELWVRIKTKYDLTIDNCEKCSIKNKCQKALDKKQQHSTKGCEWKNQ